MYTSNNKLVTNTYPAFTKAYKTGGILSEKLTYINNLDEFFIALNEETKNIYNMKCNEIINVYNDSTSLLFGSMSNKLGFFLLETKEYLILLDIVTMNDFTGWLNIIPSDIDNYDIHVKRQTINNIEYTVTNTYNSFLSFSRINNLKPNLDLNSTFYRRFFDSLDDFYYDDLSEVDSSVEDCYIDEFGDEICTDMLFKYVVLNNIIIITEYVAY